MAQKGVFLIATYVAKPKNRSMTRIAGYMDDVDNVQFDEQVGVTDKLKPRALQEAKVILDIGKKVVVKDTLGKTRTFDDWFAYYYRGNEQYIEDSLRTFGLVVEPISTPADQNVEAETTGEHNQASAIDQGA